MFKRLFERVTGTPWTTTRCAATEFGPTPGAQYRHIVANIPDELLLSFEPAQLHELLRDMSLGRLSPVQQRYAAAYAAKSARRALAVAGVAPVEVLVS